MGTEGILTKWWIKVPFQWSSRCCHILNSSADMLTTLRLAVFSEMFIVTSCVIHKMVAGENAVMWHCMLVVGKYVDGCLWCDRSRCFSRTNECDSRRYCCCQWSFYPDIWNYGCWYANAAGLLICREHLLWILPLSLAYRADTHVGVLASGRSGVFNKQNCPLAFWHVLNWSSDISIALVSSSVIPEYLFCTS